ncbi:hypothetical protein [Nitrospira sp. BLG_2]|uniref:hypothetical protein n=1 Tax=Nitrospira sp. BLG_2 TaxID=3397507 RepID=UPI003B99B326
MNYNIENELVNQKNMILDLINNEKYEDALTLIYFTAELWEKCDYAYKTKELKERIRSELLNKRQCCAHWKQHQKWDNMLTAIVP